MVSTKIWSSTTVLTLIIIRIVIWAANQNIRMISEGSCDPETFKCRTYCKHDKPYRPPTFLNGVCVCTSSTKHVIAVLVMMYRSLMCMCLNLQEWMPVGQWTEDTFPRYSQSTKIGTAMTHVTAMWSSARAFWDASKTSLTLSLAGRPS